MPFTTLQIAEHLRGELIGPGHLAIESLEQLAEAGAGQLTFIGNGAYAARWPDCQASAAVITRGLEIPPRDGRALIVVDDADLAMADLLALFAPPPVWPAEGVHPTAIVDPEAQVGPGTRIGPHCVVAAGVRLGPESVLHAHATVMADSILGRGCVLWPGVVIRERCHLGDRCVLHPNTTIGADGFGYRPDPQGGLRKIPQIGTVRIGRDVEIGANSAIDRGKFSATEVGDQCKIDNLVQIGHNCRLGRGVIVAGCSGIAGSVTIHDGAVIGGLVAVKDHVTIGAGAHVAGASVVMKDVPAGEFWSGAPARHHVETNRGYAALRRLPQLIQQVRQLARGQP